VSPRQQEYQIYLNSPEWRDLRQRVMERAGNLCEGCHRRQATEVHHLTYERFKREMMFDLVAVCRRCHAQIHHKSE
jgi:hypothetical protein